jgi:hypothetical protein
MFRVFDPLLSSIFHKFWDPQALILKNLSSRLRHCVVFWTGTHVSEEYAASFSEVRNLSSYEIRLQGRWPPRPVGRRVRKWCLGLSKRKRSHNSVSLLWWIATLWPWERPLSCFPFPSAWAITRASVTIYLQPAYIAEAFSTHQEMRNTCRILVGQHE